MPALTARVDKLIATPHSNCGCEFGAMTCLPFWSEVNEVNWANDINHTLLYLLFGFENYLLVKLSKLRSSTNLPVVFSTFEHFRKWAQATSLWRTNLPIEKHRVVKCIQLKAIHCRISIYLVYALCLKQHFNTNIIIPLD